MGKRFVRVQDVATVLGLSTKTVWRHVQSGLIASVRVGRARLIPSTEIDRIVMEAAQSRRK